MKLRACSLKRQAKLVKILARFIKKKKTQINKIRNIFKVITDTTEVERIIKCNANNFTPIEWTV